LLLLTPRHHLFLSQAQPVRVYSSAPALYVPSSNMYPCRLKV
jgi:hypothetical protein